MRRYWSAVGLAGLTFTQVALAEAGSLQLHMDKGRITIHAQGVELGQILEALSRRTGIRVVIGENWAKQPVSLVLEAKQAEETIWELLGRTGRRNYVIVYSEGARQFETFRFADAGNRALSLEAQPPSPPGSFRGSATASVATAQGSLFPPLPPSASGATFQLPPSFRRPLGGEAPGDLAPSDARPSPPVSVVPRGTLVPSFPPSPSGPRFYLPPSFRPLATD